MSHESYLHKLQCGCDCAGRMEENYEAAKERERIVRNRSGRRRNWPKLHGWHRSTKGNLTITKDGYRGTVFKNGQEFKASIVSLVNKEAQFSKRSYESEALAQFALFDIVEHLKDKRAPK